MTKILRSTTNDSDIEETFKWLVGQLKKSPLEVFDALCSFPPLCTLGFMKSSVRRSRAMYIRIPAATDYSVTAHHHQRRRVIRVVHPRCSSIYKAAIAR
jgi:hypothetical protein